MKLNKLPYLDINNNVGFTDKSKYINFDNISRIKILYYKWFVPGNPNAPWNQKTEYYNELPGDICCLRATGKYCYEHNKNNY